MNYTNYQVLMVLLLLMNLGNGQKNDHPSLKCPFRLSCTNKTKILEFPADPVPIKLFVSYINYRVPLLLAHDPNNCLPRLLLHHNNFSSLYFSFYGELTNVSFFDCSSLEQRYPRSDNDEVTSNDQDLSSCTIYVVEAFESILGSNNVYDVDLFRCTKLSDSVLPPKYPNDEVFPGKYWIYGNTIPFTWSQTSFDRRCLECKHKSKSKTILSVAGGIIGSIILGFVLWSIIRIYRYFKMKGEDHARIENFLRDYRALKPTRFSYADIKRITHQFKDKLGEGAHGAVYKGKLSSQILVAVKMLNNAEGDGNEFINEVGTMGKIYHLNVVRLLGFCADGCRRALVYEFFPKGSLHNFISIPNNNDTFLGWDKLQQIAIGIANGIEYLHQGCDQRILHFDINPHNVLVDDSFTPKITDFGLAKLCSKNQSTVSMTAARGTIGYMAPEVFSRNFGNVSYKSDIYSYGMLLLEMVGGRKNINTTMNEENLQVLYPDWIHNLLEGRDIQIPIDEEGDFRIAKKLAIVGLWCIQWHPMHRPSMKTVLQMLRGTEDVLKVPSNPFGPTSSSQTTSKTIAKPLSLELEVIRELD